MEFFKNTNIDFLGKKWYFLAFSLVFSVAGVLSIMFWHHIPLGVEFNGGTQVDVKFASTPDLDSIRKDLDRAGLHDPRLQPYGLAANHEVLITLSQKETSEAALDQGEKQIIQALNTNAPQDKRDLNNSNRDTIADALVQRDGNCRPAGRRPASEAGNIGGPVFAGRNVGVPMVPL